MLDSKASATNPPLPTKRHPKFYFDDSLVVIQVRIAVQAPRNCASSRLTIISPLDKVEDTLFKVHKHQLLKSETFTDMFKVPRGGYTEQEGASPEHPIVLRGVASADFEALMTVLYAR